MEASISGYLRQEEMFWGGAGYSFVQKKMILRKWQSREWQAGVYWDSFGKTAGSFGND